MSLSARPGRYHQASNRGQQHRLHLVTSTWETRGATLGRGLPPHRRLSTRPSRCSPHNSAPPSFHSVLLHWLACYFHTVHSSPLHGKMAEQAPHPLVSTRLWLATMPALASCLPTRNHPQPRGALKPGQTWCARGGALPAPVSDWHQSLASTAICSSCTHPNNAGAEFENRFLMLANA